MAHKKLLINLRKIKAKLGLDDEGDLPLEAARRSPSASTSPPTHVIHMNRRLSRSDASLNANGGEDGDTESKDLG